MGRGWHWPILAVLFVRLGWDEPPPARSSPGRVTMPLLRSPSPHPALQQPGPCRIPALSFTKRIYLGTGRGSRTYCAVLPPSSSRCRSSAAAAPGLLRAAPEATEPAESLDPPAAPRGALGKAFLKDALRVPGAPAAALSHGDEPAAPRGAAASTPHPSPGGHQPKGRGQER